MQPQTIILICVGIGAIVFLLWYFSADAKAKRALRRAPKLQVEDFEDGTEAKIIGSVHLLQECVSPLSKRPCAHYSVTVRQQRSTGKRTYWSTIIEEKETVAFIVDDGTGQARVHAEMATIAVVKDSNHSSGTFNDSTTEMDALLKRHGKSSVDWFGFNHGLSYREGIIEQGEQVAVYGRGRWEKPAGGGPRQLIMGHPREGLLLISDDPSTLS